MRTGNFFNWPNLSSRTMTVGLTQPPTEMSTRDIPGSSELLAQKANNLTAIYESII
jgi:hypothetical protein